MKFGQDPDDGRTALDFAKECDWEDCIELLETAQKEQKYGWYIPVGPTNNMKQYGCWEWGDKAPPKAWFLSRPGAARMQGLDPKKYGAEDFPEADEEIIAGAAPAALAPAAPAQPPIPVGLLFPGQGSQYVKMMSSIKDIPAVKDMLAKAEGILGYDVLQLCLEGPEAKLEEPGGSGDTQPISIYLSIYLPIYLSIYLSTYLYIYVICTYVYIHILTNTRILTYIYIYIYIHIHTYCKLSCLSYVCYLVQAGGAGGAAT